MKYALLDCNNFFVSCERVFDPKLRNVPVVVLSSNDGCIIARSQEAKDAKIPMGAPVFKIRDTLTRNNVRMLSANFNLYGDMSSRVMSIASETLPNIQVYSIDEAFFDLSDYHFQNKAQAAKLLREKVYKYTGIPVSIGIGDTKTLAKLANHIAKKNKGFEGVCSLDEVKDTKQIFSQIDISEVWGIGFNFSKKLKINGIYTVQDFVKQDTSYIRKLMGVTGQRTHLELQGIDCLSQVQSQKLSQSIISSRSFGEPITKKNELKEAVGSFVQKAAEKLRQEDAVASFVKVALFKKYENNFFPSKENTDKYRSKVVGLAAPTSYPPDLLKSAFKLVDELYEKNISYKKAGVMLYGIYPESYGQKTFFDTAENDDEKKKKITQAMDKVNKKMGRRILQFNNNTQKSNWLAKSKMRSKSFTTNWGDLMIVK